MANRTTQDASSLGGVQLTFTAANASDTVTGGPGVKLIVNNANASPTNVVLVTPETVEGSLPVGDRTVAVTNGTIWEIPVPARYNDPTTGLTTVTFSVTASVTYAVSRGNTS
jgi:hypothetical protein